MAVSFPNVPGVQINEVQLNAPPINGVGTSTAGFVGVAPVDSAYVNQAKLVTSAEQFVAWYAPSGGPAKESPTSTPLSYAVMGFFANGGTSCYVVDIGPGTPSTSAPASKDKSEAKATADSNAPAVDTNDRTTEVIDGIKLLESKDEIALIAAPGFPHVEVYQALINQATRTGDRFALLDPPPQTSVEDDINKLTKTADQSGVRPGDSQYAAFYYPRIMVSKQPPDDKEKTIAVTPIGHIAGVYARVDGARGVHKAPANERIFGALGVEHVLTNGDQNVLNEKGVNVLRLFSGNVVIWGARTLDVGSNYKYINVRRLVSYIEESLQQGLRWAVFEPNNLALRQQITRAIRGFLNGVWRDGALFGETPNEAYYVRFPEMSNRDEDRADGILTVQIGLRVTPPAEFIVIQIGLLLQSASAA